MYYFVKCNTITYSIPIEYDVIRTFHSLLGFRINFLFIFFLSWCFKFYMHTQMLKFAGIVLATAYRAVQCTFQLNFLSFFFKFVSASIFSTIFFVYVYSVHGITNKFYKLHIYIRICIHNIKYMWCRLYMCICLSYITSFIQNEI